MRACLRILPLFALLAAAIGFSGLVSTATPASADLIASVQSCSSGTCTLVLNFNVNAGGSFQVTVAGGATVTACNAVANDATCTASGSSATFNCNQNCAQNNKYTLTLTGVTSNPDVTTRILSPGNISAGGATPQAASASTRRAQQRRPPRRNPSIRPQQRLSPYTRPPPRHTPTARYLRAASALHRSRPTSAARPMESAATSGITELLAATAVTDSTAVVASTTAVSTTSAITASPSASSTAAAAAPPSSTTAISITTTASASSFRTSLPEQLHPGPGLWNQHSDNHDKRPDLPRFRHLNDLLIGSSNCKRGVVPQSGTTPLFFTCIPSGSGRINLGGGRRRGPRAVGKRNRHNHRVTTRQSVGVANTRSVCTGASPKSQL